ncbi:MAG TPA: DUF4097 family beta strand repeat-containing protein, partial [Vicinamibacterales bacterium]|nr:DUF4097 family beta strand repeat-containing protein [Vicinamibacterales bacterium]
GRVEIRNVNGKIDVESSSDNTVEVLATKSAKGSTVAGAKEALGRIEIVEEASPSSVRIETKVQRSRALFGSGNGQVNYRVRVPAGAEVVFATVNGGVELNGVSGRISASTTNGGVVGRDLSGTIDASTTNGGVDVDLAQLGDGGAHLECTNGGIRLRLPADARATISARVTNGGIDTGGLQLDTTESSRRRLDARLNGGGPQIRISGTNGGIRISSR